jgi:hypothetical protein
MYVCMCVYVCMSLSFIYLKLIIVYTTSNKRIDIIFQHIKQQISEPLSMLCEPCQVERVVYEPIPKEFHQKNYYNGISLPWALAFSY